MEISLFFFLPLLGGYQFCRRCLLTRYGTAREENQRLYFRAALYGIGFWVAALALHAAAFANSTDYAALFQWLNTRAFGPLFERTGSAGGKLSPEAITARAHLALICAYAFVLGTSTPLWNALLQLAHRPWQHKRDSWLRRLNRAAIKDEFERLLLDALESATPVQVSLDSDKVYVGLVLASLDPSSSARHFKLQPLMSGYRDRRGAVHFTTFYQEILEQNAGLRTLFTLVIPTERVVTASLFSFAAYEKFSLPVERQERSTPAPASPPPASTI